MCREVECHALSRNEILVIYLGVSGIVEYLSQVITTNVSPFVIIMCQRGVQPLCFDKPRGPWLPAKQGSASTLQPNLVKTDIMYVIKFVYGIRPVAFLH